jgi:hypothetical protein
MTKTLQTPTTTSPALPQSIIDAIARIDAAVQAGPTLMRVINENSAAIEKAREAQHTAEQTLAQGAADLAVLESGSAVSAALRDPSFDSARLKLAQDAVQTLEAVASTARSELDKAERLGRALQQRKSDTANDLAEARADLQSQATLFAADQAEDLLPELEGAVRIVVGVLRKFIAWNTAVPSRALSFALASNLIASPTDHSGRAPLLEGDHVVLAGVHTSVGAGWRDSSAACAIADALQPIGDALRRSEPEPEPPRHQHPRFAGSSYSIPSRSTNNDDPEEGVESTPSGRWKPGPPSIGAGATLHRGSPVGQELNLAPALTDGPGFDTVQR